MFSFYLLFRLIRNDGGKHSDRQGLSNTDHQGVVVAIKTLKDCSSGDVCSKFTLEARILAALIHPHIVTLLAVCYSNRKSDNLGSGHNVSNKDTVAMNESSFGQGDGFVTEMILEYLEQGSLLDVLRRSSTRVTLGMHSLLQVCVQIAEAMVFLERSRVIHRDLAARLVAHPVSYSFSLKIKVNCRICSFFIAIDHCFIHALN